MTLLLILRIAIAVILAIAGMAAVFLLMLYQPLWVWVVIPLTFLGAYGVTMIAAITTRQLKPLLINIVPTVFLSLAVLFRYGPAMLFTEGLIALVVIAVLALYGFAFVLRVPTTGKPAR